MKKAFLLSAMAVLALSSCVKDTVVDMQKDEIKFSVTTDVATKAGAVATTTNTIEDFTVWAYTNDAKLYINDKATKENDEWKLTGTYFWPDSDLDFYAFAPTSYLTTYPPTMANDAQAITCATDGSVDLLYAVTRGQTKLANETGVSINFRHAFSQLIFRAYNENVKLGVNVNGVTLAQSYTKGTFILPAQTADNLNNTVANDRVSVGHWTTSAYQNISDLAANITAQDIGQKKSVANGGAQYLTTGANDNGISNIEGLYVLPQELKYWNPEAEFTGDENTAYFIISCKVWTKSPDGDVYLWGTADEYKNIAVPVVIPNSTDGVNSTFTWNPGYRYVYTFNFTEGAGYVPPVEDDTDGTDPVLVPIKVNITVDEFINGEIVEIDTDLETE